MKSIDAVRKHYDQLTPLERVSLSLAAGMRDDEAEQKALTDSAPRKDYRLYHHFFIAAALQDLALTHVTLALNAGCFLLTGQGALHHLDKAEEVERFNQVWEGLQGIAVGILEAEEAWQRFCKDLAIDSDAVLIDIPGSGLVSPGGPEAQGALPLVLEIARTFCEHEPSEENINVLFTGYKEAYLRLVRIS